MMRWMLLLAWLCSTPCFATCDFVGGEYLTIADDDRLSLDLANDFSIVAYVKNDSLTTGDQFQYLLSHGTAGSANSYFLTALTNDDTSSGGTLQGIFRFQMTDSGSNSVTTDSSNTATFGNPPFKNTRRHCIAITYDASEDATAIYVDGLLRGTADTSGLNGGTINPSGSLYIGARSDLNGDRHYRARAGDIFKVQRKLSLEEIRQCAGFIDPATLTGVGTAAGSWHLPLLTDQTTIYPATLTVDDTNGGTIKAYKFRIMPDDHLHIATAGDVATVRAQVIADVWRDGGGIPTTLATSVDLSDTTYLDYLGGGEIFDEEEETVYSLLDHVEAYTITTAGEASNDDTVVDWLLVPKNPTTPKRLMIWGFGHGVGFTAPREESIVAALQSGCYVLLVPMPHGGTNVAANITAHHNTLGTELTGTFNPHAYFFNPAIRGLNESISRHGPFVKVGMAGVSGGGWQALVIPAVDTRINCSLACASNLPIEIRGTTRFWAAMYYENDPDWEQQLDGLTYNGSGQLSYLDLHVLASSNGRKHYQVNNALETTSGGYRGYQYRDEVIAAATASGGTFDMLFDHDETVHTLSTSWTATLFMPELMARPYPVFK